MPPSLRLAEDVERDALIAECAIRTDGASDTDLTDLCHVAA
ncbi:MAG: hypothetical protein ACYC7E_04840 [Armatimonadota bacterium]